MPDVTALRRTPDKGGLHIFLKEVLRGSMHVCQDGENREEYG
jgi:hypothetical protein